MPLITRANIPRSQLVTDPVGTLLRSGLGGLQLGQGIASAVQKGKSHQQEQQQKQQSNALAKQALGLGEDDSPQVRQNALASLAATDPNRADRVLGFQANVRNRLIQADERSRSSMIEGALEARLSNDPVGVLRRRRESLGAQGLPTAETDSVISQFESGDQQGALDTLDSAISFGQSIGVIKRPASEESTTLIKNLEAAGIEKGSPEFAQAVLSSILDAPSEDELGIKRATLDIRKEEQRQRALDRDIVRETNEIKRDELRERLAQSKQKSESLKKQKQFDEDSSLATIDQTIGTVDDLLASEGLSSAAGIDANFPTIAGSKAANFEAKLETLQSQAFLSQVEKLKGLGALSENEGKKLASAIGAISLDMSDRSLRESLRQIRTTLEDSKDRFQRKIGVDTDEKVGDVFTIDGFEVEVE